MKLSIECTSAVLDSTPEALQEGPKQVHRVSTMKMGLL